MLRVLLLSFVACLVGAGVVCHGRQTSMDAGVREPSVAPTTIAEDQSDSPNGRRLPHVRAITDIPQVACECFPELPPTDWQWSRLDGQHSTRARLKRAPMPASARTLQVDQVQLLI